MSVRAVIIIIRGDHTSCVPQRQPTVVTFLVSHGDNHHRYWRRHNEYMCEAVRIKRTAIWTNDGTMFLPFPDMRQTISFVSEGVVADVWKKDAARRKELEMTFLTSLVGAVLCSDHTFWNTKVSHVPRVFNHGRVRSRRRSSRAERTLEPHSAFQCALRNHERTRPSFVLGVHEEQVVQGARAGATRAQGALFEARQSWSPVVVRRQPERG